MSLVVMTMPDSPQQQRDWLERELMGLRLTKLIAELSVIHGAATPLPLDEVIGPYRDEIGQRGLQGIPDETLSQLLRQPRLLLALQEFILTEGGPYWDSVLKQQPQLDEILARGQRQVAALVSGSTPAPTTTLPTKTRQTSWLGIWLALAASVILVISTWWQLQQPPVWGWNRPTALAADGSAAEYLNHLADGAKQWFDQNRDNASDLNQCLGEMRRGCDRLLAARHEPLTQADRDWLTERCQVWSAKFDRQQAELKSGEKDVDQVRTEADTTVNQLIQALQNRARQVFLKIHRKNHLPESLSQIIAPVPLSQERPAMQLQPVSLFALAALVLLPSSPLTAQDDAARARAVLEANCFRCHGKDGTRDGRIDFMLDADRLVAAKKIVKGKPEESRLYLRLNLPETDPDVMPPEGEKPRPSRDDIAAVEKWIRDGAKPFPEPKVVQEPKRQRLDDKYVYQAMLTHLEKNRDDARYIRFLTLQVQHNNLDKIKASDMRLYRAGIAKLLNSLSWKRNLVFPKPVDPAEIVLALDLRDLDWDLNDAWKKIVGYTADEPKEQFHPGYPYALTHDKYPEDDDLNRIAADVYRLTGTRIPALRADWFLATASVPPLYHELLNLPTTARELEERLKVNVAVNFQRGALARAGFEGSEVSAQANRLVERHESTYGYYYPSYDFRSGDGLGNLKQFPLGPLNFFARGQHPYEDFAFKHDGGEIIFSLPNGQQGYLLVNGEGKRINEGPPDVVRDKKETAGKSTLIINGLSCMACHIHGMIALPKDEIRLNPGRLQGEALTRLKKLYPTNKRMADLLAKDEEQYLDSLEKIIKPYLRVGEDKTKDIKLFPEPVTAIASPFLKGLVSLNDAALELGIDPAKLKAAIENNPVLRDDLGLAILANGGTIRREVWQSPRRLVSPFQAAAAELKLGGAQHTRR